MTPPVGTFCLVLHSHLPHLAHHGRWPVGEEWLYQAWAQSYLPVLDVLHRLADEGRRDLLTLGVTPVLAAQLDDPYCLRGLHDWLGGWILRAHEAAPRLPALAADEHRRASAALALFEGRWRHGGSPVLRALAEAGVVELLGGPATHPFAPLLDADVRGFALEVGLADAELRVGRRPRGIWAPECGYAPGMEAGYAAAGVGHVVVDGPALRGDTGLARPVGGSDVLCFGRDLDVSYRVWSPRAGYPGGHDYRDFHTFDHSTGLKPARVTGRSVPPQDKRPYDPTRAAAAVARDAADFVTVVRERLATLRERRGRPALAVAAFDTELFGHWWSEGPAWLEAVLRTLPDAGVQLRTLRGALDAGLVGSPVELPASSWGSGKDWRVWDVAEFTSVNSVVQKLLRKACAPGLARDPLRDVIAGQALLALSSDWAFMASKRSAADYARRRAGMHAERVAELAALLAAGRRRAAWRRVTAWPDPQPVFGHLDARRLGPGAAPPPGARHRRGGLPRTGAEAPTPGASADRPRTGRAAEPAEPMIVETGT